MADGHYDVIVVGSGPGGATLAQKLAPTGKRILLLERGDFLPRSPANWNSETVFVEGVQKTKGHGLVQSRASHNVHQTEPAQPILDQLQDFASVSHRFEQIRISPDFRSSRTWAATISVSYFYHRNFLPDVSRLE